ncbi:MAG: hypothetical protein FWF26_02940 [Treponema sp.]|nr:hypothetical protein [Treponema sp.]
MKKNLHFYTFSLLFFVFGAAFLPAQTAAEMEDLLNTGAVNYGQAARFVLKAADTPAFSNLDQLPSSSGAFNYAMGQKWLPKTAESNGKASLEGVSLLIMRSFGIKGGLMYTLFKNPHYAFREMVYQDIIQGRNDPQMDVSGETLIFLINRVISRTQEDVDYDTVLENQQ